MRTALPFILLDVALAALNFGLWFVSHQPISLVAGGFCLAMAVSLVIMARR